VIVFEVIAVVGAVGAIALLVTALVHPERF
jgi:hypothetical protein